MKPSEAAKLAGVSPDTLKRWLKTYPDFFSPLATPEKGTDRDLIEHDQRVALLISSLRNTGQSTDVIRKRLEEVRAGDYADLPPLPPQEAGSVSLAMAASRANEMVENARLQSELKHMQQMLTQSREQVQVLEAELKEARTAEQGHTGRIHELEVSLERARGEVTTLQARLEGEVGALQARLEGYAFGGSRLVSPALLIMAGLAAGVVIALIVFVVMQLAM